MKIIRNCLGCDKNFEARLDNQIYCSRKCKEKSRIRINAHLETPRKKYENCLVCGKPNDRYSRGAKTCSNKDCQRLWINAVKKIRGYRIQKIFEKYKTTKGCSICGYNKCPDSLDFHHLYNKSFRIQARDWWAFTKYNSERVKNELDKCVLVCKNCHYEIGFNERTVGHKEVLEGATKIFNKHLDENSEECKRELDLLWNKYKGVENS